jgi:hypothetical protein
MDFPYKVLFNKCVDKSEKQVLDLLVYYEEYRSEPMVTTFLIFF